MQLGGVSCMCGVAIGGSMQLGGVSCMCGETRVFHVRLSCHFFRASCASCHVQVFAILATAAQSQVSTVALAVAPAVADF